MRSRTPFFESPVAREVVSAVADCTDPLLIYCGAGVSIDRTGLSWAGLIESCFPARHSKHYLSGPLRGEVKAGGLVQPEQLASSLVFTLRRVANESSETLQDTLRKRIKRSLYGDKAIWQAGELVPEIMKLAFLRSIAGRSTTILTTNYDDHLESGYIGLRNDLDSNPDLPIPGLRVSVLSPEEEAIVEYAPANMANEPASTISLVYLHGRVPRVGDVSWPIVLDENSYAATASLVGAALRQRLRGHAMTLIVGSSLQDAPLVRALSETRRAGSRVAVFAKQSIRATFDDEGEALALELAIHRAQELGVRAVFADFHGQVAQLVQESFLRTAFREPRPEYPWADHYMSRLERWWTTWSDGPGVSDSLPTELRSGLAEALPILGLSPERDPRSTIPEGHRLELWVRANPTGQDRQLVRWVTSENSAVDGVNGKCGRLESPSYLAPVRAFAEGRASAYDIGDLETGRESQLRYTSKSFLAVPVRQEGAIVGVLSLASTSHLAHARMMKSHETTASLVTYLSDLGTRLLRG